MRFLINGFPVEAEFSPETVQGQLIPLLRQLTRLYNEKGARVIAFLAAPPAAGKSTVAAMLEYLSGNVPGLARVQSLGIDGYHYPRAYIESHTVRRGGTEIPMRRVKGAPDTFDVAALADTLCRVRESGGRWNGYSRVTHDILKDAIEVTAPIVLVEGNWLLLDREPWNRLSCDVSIFLRCDTSLLKARLIGRKIRGGSTPEEAEAFYTETDGPNAVLCLRESRKSDIIITME